MPARAGAPVSSIGTFITHQLIPQRHKLFRWQRFGEEVRPVVRGGYERWSKESVCQDRFGSLLQTARDYFFGLLMWFAMGRCPLDKCCLTV